jgi:nicotinamidase-related amidase
VPNTFPNLRDLVGKKWIEFCISHLSLWIISRLEWLLEKKHIVPALSLKLTSYSCFTHKKLISFNTKHNHTHHKANHPSGS